MTRDGTPFRNPQLKTSRQNARNAHVAQTPHDDYRALRQKNVEKETSDHRANIGP